MKTFALDHLRFNESWYKQYRVTPHFSTNKIYRKKIKYWEKINIDTIKWENLFDRSANHKLCNILWLVRFKPGKRGKHANMVGHNVKIRNFIGRPLVMIAIPGLREVREALLWSKSVKWSKGLCQFSFQEKWHLWPKRPFRNTKKCHLLW